MPTLWCVFLFGTGPRGPCNFRTIAKQKEFFRQEFLNNFIKKFARPSFGVREIAIWSRIMILYETISRGLAVRCRPAGARAAGGGPAPVARWR